MRMAIGWLVLSATALTAVLLNAAEPVAARAAWPLWDGKESVADYAKRAGIKDVQTEVDLGGGVTMKLTLIPAGKFTQGLHEEEAETIEGVRVLVREADKGWSQDAGPQREVTISKPFYMGIYEVTQEQFQQIMGFNQSAVKDQYNPKPEVFVGKNRPVNNVQNTGMNPKGFMADEFCEKVSAKTGMKVSLPTGAQWEYACLAGTKTRYYFGDDPAETYKYENYGDKSLTADGLDTYVHHKVQGRDKSHDDGFDKTAPVGSFKPNPWGLYDMLGNVSEWVSDWTALSYFGAPTVDPAGPAYTLPPGHSWRHSRGGNFLGIPGTIFRNGGHAPYLITHYGFRVVVALKSPVVQAQEGKNQNPPKAAAAPAMAKNKSPLKAPATAGPSDPKVRVPPGCRAAAGTQAEPYTKSGWAQAIVHEATGMEMVYVPAGSFLMGVNPEDKAYPYLRGAHVGGGDAGQHRVTLTKGCYMGKTEVTQALWEKVMGSNPAHFKNAGPEAPVESVSWENCQNFCQKAGGGLRLPTEAEWEYACRAGTEGLYAGDPEEMGWYLSNSDGTPQAVGTKKPNAWGLYDMHGNVWEFCQDFFGPYDSSGDAVTDPTGPTKAGSPPARVIRGGGWGDYGAYCISAIRGHFSTAQSPGNPAPVFPAVGCRFVIPAAGAP